jgi:DNA repair protein RadC
MTPDGPPRRIADLNAARALFAPLAGEQAEVAAFAYLDPEWRLLGLRHTHGRGDMIEVPVRAIAADALAFDAAAVLMAHNHPSGDARPSAADRQMTRRLARLFDALGINLLDHLVLAGEMVVSFRALGLL